jgi:hypothetical protein
VSTKPVFENLQGLDLELSQTNRNLNNLQYGGVSPKQGNKNIIEKGAMIDSLDLNIGYEHFTKLRD